VDIKKSLFWPNSACRKR